MISGASNGLAEFTVRIGLDQGQRYLCRADVATLIVRKELRRGRNRLRAVDNREASQFEPLAAALCVLCPLG